METPWENLTPISVPTGVICLFTIPLLYRQHQVSVTGPQLAASQPNTSHLTVPPFTARVLLTDVPVGDRRTNWYFHS